MDTIQTYQAIIIEWVRENEQWMMRTALDLETLAEPAFQEYETATYVENSLRSFGYQVDRPLTTSVRGMARTHRRSKQRPVVFLADMDAVYCPEHPCANQSSGFAHACGHHIQMVHALAIAKFWHDVSAWRNAEFPLEVVFCPAEEFASLKYAATNDQTILSGKQMLLAGGMFDSIKEVISSHIYPGLPAHSVLTHVRHPGFVVMRIAWSGDKPLKASICIHQYLEMLHTNVNKKGIAVLHGDGYQLMRKRGHFLVEAYVVFQGKNPENFLFDKMIADMRQALKRQMPDVDIGIVEGYRPFMPETGLLRKFDRLLAKDFRQLRIVNNLALWRDGATDLGDVSVKAATIQLYFSGAEGNLHNADFTVTNFEEAVYTPVQLFLSYLLYGYKGE